MSQSYAPPPPPPPYAPAAALPERVLFTHKYGFFMRPGHYYGMEEGNMESEPEMIKLLIERGAPILTKESEINDWRIIDNARRVQRKIDDEKAAAFRRQKR